MNILYIEYIAGESIKWEPWVINHWTVSTEAGEMHAGKNIDGGNSTDL
jgi:hypothetical protein